MEIPRFKRCCCCVPLRYGLITWGYLKIVVSACFVTALGSNLFFYAMFAMGSSRFRFDWELIMILAIFLILICDVVLHVVYLVGAHMKIPKLLRVYYYYSMVFVAVFILVYTTIVCGELKYYYYVRMNDDYQRFLRVLTVRMGVGVFNVVLHSYLILLVRSEILKLSGNCEFRFVNNAAEAEAECVLDIKQNGITQNGSNYVQNEGTDIQDQDKNLDIV